MGGDEEYREVYINETEQEVSTVPKSISSSQSSLMCLQPQ